MPTFKKGSKAAKDYMAKIRAKKKQVKTISTKVGAVKKREYVKILGQNVIKGSKAHEKLLYIVKHSNDIQKHETNFPNKKVGAIKIVEKNETKLTRPTKVYQQTRTKSGTFKSLKRIAGTSTHKDTKSHNVNIRVVSGIAGAFNNLENLIKEKEKAEIKINTLKVLIKDSGDIQTKNHHKFWLKKYKSYLLGLKKQITEAKKHI